MIDLLCGEMADVLADYPDDLFDAAITDPPYGLGYMDRAWDTFTPGAQRTGERVIDLSTHANPNVRGRTRSPAISPSQIEYDYSLTGLRRFQREVTHWGETIFRVLKPGAYLLMCGAPRSYHRMASGLEDAGFEIRDCLTWLYGQGFPKSLNLPGGLGTALKPGWEPIVLARKPFPKLTVQQCYDAYGTGALYIDAARVGDYKGGDVTARLGKKAYIEGASTFGVATGRWPANVLLDDDAALALDAQTEAQVSRFFYCAKPSRSERDRGCDDVPATSAGAMTGGRKEGSAGLNSPRAGAGRVSGGKNAHPTVKPIALMRWLIRLVTAPDALILDPFVGSGTTALAARYEGRSCVGIDREPEYIGTSLLRLEGHFPETEEVA